MNFRPLLVLSLLGFAVTVLKSVGKLLFYRIYLHQHVHTVSDNHTITLPKINAKLHGYE